ncbi:AIR carboxylase family protein [Candidatus Woesearchaeota archaeon]|nr:AIR carboxylase family protein [Candidatus Woesearchaeota archaeon]
MKDVLVLFASKGDKAFELVKKTLEGNDVSYEFKLASAHKTPDDVDNSIKGDYKVIISGAGLAAALPGVIAAKTLRPVIGVPCSGNYEGLDALLTIMQMPPAIPVLGVGVDQGKIAAEQAINILKQPKKIVMVGDQNTKAFLKAEKMLKDFNINHTHSQEVIDDAINIHFTKFDEPIPKKEQLVIYCPVSDEESNAESALNILKHSDHGVWVGLNNGTNAALAAIEILNLDNSQEQKLTTYRHEQAEKVREYNK